TTPCAARRPRIRSRGTTESEIGYSNSASSVAYTHSSRSSACSALLILVNGVPVTYPSSSGGTVVASLSMSLSSARSRPLTLLQEHPCELYAERQKHARYDAGFKGSRFDFAAVVFETSGAVNSEGNDIIKQLQAILNRDYSDV